MLNKKYLPNSIAALWGFAEATVFFIIPDVFISYRALTGLRAALRACIYTLVGALIGGLLMYTLAAHSQTALTIVRHVPGIPEFMVTTANQDYVKHGALAILIAPVRTAPYKLYTVLAPAHGIGFLTFLAISVVARLTRFVLIAVIVCGLSKLLGRWFNQRTRTYILIAFWVIFYGIYFYFI